MRYSCLWAIPHIWALWTSLVAQLVKNPPEMRETWVQSLGWENPLEKGMTTHSSILTWRIPWTKEPGGLQSMGSQWVRHDWETNIFTFSLFILSTVLILINTIYTRKRCGQMIFIYFMNFFCVCAWKQSQINPNKLYGTRKKKIFIGVSTFMSLNKNKYISIDCSYYAWFHAR